VTTVTSLDISVSNLTLKQLFEESFYTIDYYQREYAWGEEEVRTLITDLREAFFEWADARELRRRPHLAPQYFLGPFVYYEQGRGLRSLVDGQQRFTTLHLIFLQLHIIGRHQGKRAITEMLGPVVRRYDNYRPRYRIDLEERSSVLDAIFDERRYEPSAGDSLSVGNLWRRSQDIETLLREIPSEYYTFFVNWLLDRVMLAGIRAPDSGNAFRIFESMNDRGARLTPIDLVKSYLLANVGEDEAKLNEDWRRMLAELTTARDDPLAPARFVKAALQAKHARLQDGSDDMAEIDKALNLWVRRHETHLGLTEPGRFHAFVDALLRLATLHRTFLHASRTLQPDLQEIFFNERNGLDAQMIAILAAVRPGEPLAEAKDKARRIAAYLDRWYVLRILNDLPVQSRDVMDCVRDLLPGLRECRTTTNVSRVLAQHVAREGYETIVLDGFGLRGTNRHQIKYLLARLTAYAQDQSGRRGDVAEYLSDTRPYQIEHLFANKPDRHSVEISDPVRFRSLRNQFGGLVLLPDRDNASLGAMPFDDKVKRYGRQDVLVGVLDRDYHPHFPGLYDFTKSHDLASLLRPFKRGAAMEEIIKIRQELYLRLCSHIWSLDRLDIDRKNLPDYKDPFDISSTASMPPAQRPRRRLTTHLAGMVAAGVLEPGTRIVLVHKGTAYAAIVDAGGYVTLENTGTVYSKVDGAANIIRNTKSSDGMKLWTVVSTGGNAIPLRELREQAISTGALGRRRS
jgi:hypothetical protein